MAFLFRENRRHLGGRADRQTDNRSIAHRAVKTTDVV